MREAVEPFSAVVLHTLHSSKYAGQRFKSASGPLPKVTARARVAAEQWAGIDSSDAAAIYSLRCAVAHGFGLVDLVGTPPRTFELDSDIRNIKPLVHHPKVAWNGTLSGMSDSTTTTIGIPALGALCTTVRRELLTAATVDRLWVCHPHGVDGLDFLFYEWSDRGSSHA